MSHAPMTAEQFAAATPRRKGYLVARYGGSAVEPHVPVKYEPLEADLAEFERGQLSGILADALARFGPYPQKGDGA